jgi:hypothetical protein
VNRIGDVHDNLSPVKRALLKLEELQSRLDAIVHA